MRGDKNTVMVFPKFHLLFFWVFIVNFVQLVCLGTILHCRQRRDRRIGRGPVDSHHLLWEFSAEERDRVDAEAGPASGGDRSKKHDPLQVRSIHFHRRTGSNWQFCNSHSIFNFMLADIQDVFTRSNTSMTFLPFQGPILVCTVCGREGHLQASEFGF